MSFQIPVSRIFFHRPSRSPAYVRTPRSTFGLPSCVGCLSFQRASLLSLSQSASLSSLADGSTTARSSEKSIWCWHLNRGPAPTPPHWSTGVPLHRPGAIGSSLIRSDLGHMRMMKSPRKNEERENTLNLCDLLLLFSTKKLTVSELGKEQRRKKERTS